MPYQNAEEVPLDPAINAGNVATLEAWRDFMDLPVQLAVELGRTKLSVRAILELEVNSIIQLARSTGEGVDVLASRCIIGRGEIVMIEDRTGVRINEILGKV
ncbi:MAG: FliM/FliN family flagellar motor switch protein [Pyrinomonadaceae bacterium]